MTLEEMKKVILTDPETRNLAISDVDIYKVFVYLQDRDQKTVIDGYRPVLKTDPYVEIVYEPTKEKEMELKKNRIRKHLKFYDSEIYIQDASLSRFEVFNDEREKAYRLAVEFVENYKPDHYIKGLYIFGKYATGKSYLLSAIAQALAERNITVLFVYA